MSNPRRRAAHKPSSHGRPDSADAFFRDPGEGPARAPDDLAEELAEEFLASATTGQEQGEEAHEQFVDEEIGGPFVTSTSGKEFGYAYDESNIPGTMPEAYPTTSGSGGGDDDADASAEESEWPPR